MILRRAAILACLLILASSAGFCDTATMGRYGPMQMSFTSEKLEPPLILNWEFTSNRSRDNAASPLVADGVCYFTSGDRIYAIDLETGTMKWKYPVDQTLTSTVKATPAIDNGKLYFGTTDGKLYCLNAENGTFGWFFETRGAIRCPPVVLNSTLYFTSDDNSIYTLDADTGDNAWLKPYLARDNFSNGIAVAEGIVTVACMDGNLYGLNGSGKLKWYTRLPSAPIKSSPIITSNITIMAVGNVMYGISTRSGQRKWMVQLPSDVSATPSTDGLSVFVPCRDKKLYCYNITGRQPTVKWTAPADIGAVVSSSPTIADQIVYVTAAHGIVAAYSVADGSLKWRYVIAPSSISAPGYTSTNAASSPIVSGDSLLVLTDDGVLHCFTNTAPDTIPPDAYYITPVNGARMSGAPPIKFSATLYDIGSGVNLGIGGEGNGSGSATMLLDGNPVELTADLNTNTVSYSTPVGDSKTAVVKPLKDGLHIVTLNVKDYAGNQFTKEWCFTADSTMPPPRTIKKDVGKKTKEPKNQSKTSDTSNSGDTSQSSTTLSPPPPPLMPGGGGTTNNVGRRRNRNTNDVPVPGQ